MSQCYSKITRVRLMSTTEATAMDWEDFWYSPEKFGTWHPEDKNTMNTQQLEQFKFNYAQMLVEGMDMKTLEQFAIESIEENIKDWDEEEIKSEILDFYDQDMLNSLLPDD